MTLFIMLQYVIHDYLDYSFISFKASSIRPNSCELEIHKIKLVLKEEENNQPNLYFVTVVNLISKMHLKNISNTI